MNNAKRIKELRNMTGLSQTKFGDLYGIPMRTIQSWEAGEREAPEYVVDLLEQAVWTNREESYLFWAVVDATEDSWDYTKASSKTAAMRIANLQWEKMSEHDRKRRTDFYVGLLCEDNLDACVISRNWV